MTIPLPPPLGSIHLARTEEGKAKAARKGNTPHTLRELEALVAETAALSAQLVQFRREVIQG